MQATRGSSSRRSTGPQPILFQTTKIKNEDEDQEEQQEEYEELFDEHVIVREKKK